MSLDQSRAAAARLAEIDALQDDVLRRIDELERRTADVLAQCLGPGQAAGEFASRYAPSHAMPRREAA